MKSKITFSLSPALVILYHDFSHNGREHFLPSTKIVANAFDRVTKAVVFFF